jgi:hypothetical protein
MADLGENDGQIWKESTSEGQEGYARTEERNLEKRKVKEEGHEPETGDRYRAFRGSSCGRKGTQKENFFQEKSVVWKENFFEEKILRPQEEVVQLLIIYPRRPLASEEDQSAGAHFFREMFANVDRRVDIACRSLR